MTFPPNLKQISDWDAEVAEIESGSSQPPVPFVQDADPGAVGEGAIWVDTSSDPPVLKIRNDADDDWIVSGGNQPAVPWITVAPDGYAGTGTADYVCTGTDDQVVIQAALDAADSDDLAVLLLPGTFHVTDTVTIPSNGTLMGATTGAYSDNDFGTGGYEFGLNVEIDATMVAPAPVIYASNGDTTVSGLKINVGFGDDVVGIDASSDYATVADCFVSGTGGFVEPGIKAASYDLVLRCYTVQNGGIEGGVVIDSTVSGGTITADYIVKSKDAIQQGGPAAVTTLDVSGDAGFFGTPATSQPIVPLTAPVVQDVIDALVVLGLVSQSD